MNQHLISKIIKLYYFISILIISSSCSKMDFLYNYKNKEKQYKIVSLEGKYKKINLYRPELNNVYYENLKQDNKQEIIYNKYDKDKISQVDNNNQIRGDNISKINPIEKTDNILLKNNKDKDKIKEEEKNKIFLENTNNITSNKSTKRPNKNINKIKNKYIQIGSYKIRNNAKIALDKISKKYKGKIKNIKYPNGNIVNKVIVGPIARDDIDYIINDLKKMGYKDAFIIK